MTATTETAATALARIWEDLLGVPVAPDDDFFDLGGYSLLVVEVVERARAAGIDLKAVDVFDAPTVAGLAARIEGGSGGPAGLPEFHADMVARVWRESLGPYDDAVPPSLVPLIPEGEGEPLFCVHLGTGHVRLFGDLAEGVGHGRPVYGFEAIGYRAPVRPFLSIAETAERYLAELRTVQRTGPYHLTGLCAGGVIALEMAQRLTAAGERVESLVLIDPPYGMPELDPGWGVGDHFAYLLGSLKAQFGLHDPVADLPGVLAELRDRLWFERTDRIEDFYRLVVLWAAAQFAQEHYEPRPYAGRAAILSPPERVADARRYWEPLLTDVDVRLTEHATMMKIVAEPVVTELFGELLAGWAPPRRSE